MYALKIYKNYFVSSVLFLGDEMDYNDAGFIGCWWLGGVVFGGFEFILVLCMLFIPKHFPEYYTYHKDASKASAVKHSSTDDGTSGVILEVKGEYFPLKNTHRQGELVLY